MILRSSSGLSGALRRPLARFTLALAIVAAPFPALAQSAADKTTARTLAKEGITLFKANNFADALDRLQRAEALYDAHVHVLYIARCQVRLGRLVEAAENYRALARKPLPSDASDVVKSAKADGADELSKLEPRIPSLRVDVQPNADPSVKMSINGEFVSSAAIGIDRPVNPGKLVVKVGGPGWKTAEQTVELPEAQRKTLTFSLEKGAGDPTFGADEGKPKDSTVPPGPENLDRGPIKLGIVAGFRVSAVLPVGSLKGTWNIVPPQLPPKGWEVPKNSKITDLVDAGVNFSGRLGFRFMENFTGLALGELTLYNARAADPNSAQFNDIGLAAFPSSETRGTAHQGTASQPLGIQGGVGFMYSRAARGRLGWFAEADFLLQKLSTSVHVTSNGAYSCDVDLSLSGATGRLSGGVVLPVARFLELHPFGGVALGQYSSGRLTGSCSEPVDAKFSGMQATLSLGVGGDFIVGLDRR